MSEPAYKQNEAIDMNSQAQVQPQGATKEGPERYMDGPERAIYRCLSHGRRRAVSVQSIVQATNLNDVAVRETIRHLIMQHNIPIASVTSFPNGFYIIDTPEEVQVTTKSLRNRGIKILQRAAKLQKISLEQVFDQGKLELGLAKPDHDKAQREMKAGIAEEHASISGPHSEGSDIPDNSNVIPIGPGM